MSVGARVGEDGEVLKRLDLSYFLLRPGPRHLIRADAERGQGGDRPNYPKSSFFNSTVTTI
eukprot:4830287-Pleurochrysis_carterae.AAC.1